jgi:hypothetical protein
MDPFVLVLVSTAIGWVMSELSHRFRRRPQRRDVLGRALVELLEIRRRVRGLQLLFAMFSRKLDLPPGDDTELMAFLELVSPSDPDLPERYDRAITELAATHPLLAFKLTTHKQVPIVLSALATQASAMEAFDLAKLQRTLELARTAGLEEIEGAISEVGWAHGIGTWIYTRKVLRKRVKLPQKAEAFSRDQAQSESKVSRKARR